MTTNFEPEGTSAEDIVDMMGKGQDLSMYDLSEEKWSGIPLHHMVEQRLEHAHRRVCDLWNYIRAGEKAKEEIEAAIQKDENIIKSIRGSDLRKGIKEFTLENMEKRLAQIKADYKQLTKVF